jgi:hypothetical protein
MSGRRIAPDAISLPLRQFVGSVSRRTAAFALKAKAFSHWAYQTRHCSFCGAALVQGETPRTPPGEGLSLLRQGVFSPYFAGGDRPG